MEMNSNELLARIEKLEKEVQRQVYAADAVEIQNLMARYIFYLENGWISRVWDDLFAHDDPDLRVEIMDSGAYRGPEHVKRLWETMGGKVDLEGRPVAERPAPMSNTNTDRASLLLMLTISTPLIEVSEDRQHAWGQWHLFGPHTNRVFDPEVGGKKDTAFWIAGKYDNEFVRVNGEWKFQKLHPICWLRTPYHKSFLECPDCRRTPTPYWPPDEPPTIHSFNPDEGPNPNKWGPFPHEHIPHL